MSRCLTLAAPAARVRQSPINFIGSFMVVASSATAVPPVENSISDAESRGVDTRPLAECEARCTALHTSPDGPSLIALAFRAHSALCQLLERSLHCVVTMARASMILTVLALSTAISGQAQAASDPWLPGSWKFNASVATGVPFLVMSEVALGVTDHAAIGLLGGTTPIVSGFGVRPRVALPILSGLRFLASAPVVYYPPHADGPAWWLARPAMMLDWQTASALSLAGGPSGRGQVGLHAH